LERPKEGHQKSILSSFFFGRRGMCTNRNLFPKTSPQKNAGSIHFMFRGRIISRIFKEFKTRNPNQSHAALWRIFSSNKSVPANRKKDFIQAGLLKNEEI
jgi:hypothetical protein